MSRATLTWANGSTILNKHSNTRQKYQSTVDQARAYAAELGPDLALAFDTLSNKTALVLRAFVAAMYQEGHSYSEIDDIWGAMKHYFEDTFHCFGTYWQFLPDQSKVTIIEGEMSKDDERGEWIGNPVFDKVFVGMMQDLKDQDERSDTRQAKRRTAIGYEDITKLMLHLQKPETVEAEGLARCLFFQAFAATAFTLWLTFDEVLKLKRGDVLVRQPDPDGPSSFSVTVPFRNSNPIDPARANVYEIYLQPEEPHSCCATHLHAWIQQLELKKGQKLPPNEYLFPDLGDNDHIQQEKPFSVTQVSDQLNKYAMDTGIMDHRYNRLDTHCFRRGGAQHRLSAQDPWPFKAIKWWGGWSEREHAEKILEYLWDDLQYEASFGDIMSPLGSKARVHAGTARLPAETMVTRECLKYTIRSIESRHTAAVAKIEKGVQELRQQNMEFRRESIEWRSAINLQLEKVVHMLSSPAQDPPRCPFQQPDQSQQPSQHPEESLLESQPDHLQPDHSQPDHSQPDHSQQPDQHPEESLLESRPDHSQPDQSQQPSQHPEESLLESQPLHRSPPQLPPDLSKRKHSQPLHRVPPREKPQECHSQPKGRRTSQTIPVISHWKEAVLQWEQGDRDKGLDVPLSEWTHAMSHRNCTYNDRKLIFEEFESFGRSGARMRKVYGNSMNGLKKLLIAIRSRRKLKKKGVEDRGQEAEQQEEEEEEEGLKEHWPKVPRIKTWRQAVQQWEIGDPTHGLGPISKWPLVRRRSRRSHSSYSRRRTIAGEYEYCGRDEHRMRQLHSAAMDRLSNLVESINRQKRLRRQKKAGIVVDEESVEGEVEDESADEWEDDELEEEEEPLVKKRKVVTFDSQTSFKKKKP
ncbi:hypothetical protein CPB97_009988 [Podila verticillata]|nr:hypothetical protein CPB97_009988 [Podila verticillata]